MTPTRSPAVAGPAAALLVATTVLATACAGGPEPDAEAAPGPPDPVESSYAAGIAALDSGDFDAARAALRPLAARCEAGDRGRGALLALAVLELDLRNPRGTPSDAAHLAAVHLNLPGAGPEERAMARTLYLEAVYRGAEPVVGPDGPSGSGGTDSVPAPREAVAGDAAEATAPVSGGPFVPARRFVECDAGPPSWTGVPEYPAVPPSSWSRLDSLPAEIGPALEPAALRFRVERLEAELARIRKLLGGGDGGEGERRP